MIETWRWAKALFSAASSACTLTPSRAAASRSMTSRDASPARCWSEETSIDARHGAELARPAPRSRSAARRGRATSRTYWYRALPAPPPMLMSCTARMKVCTPGMRASGRRRRLITSSAVTPGRSSSGLSEMKSRPELTEGAPPPAPTCEPTLATAGIGTDHLHHPLLQAAHRLEGGVGRAGGVADDEAGVLLGEEALGHDDVEPDGQRRPARPSKAAPARRQRSATARLRM